MVNRKQKLALLFLALLSTSFFSSPLFAKESGEFADKVIKEHGLSGDAAAKLKKILTTDRFLTRNIGTEDPWALQGPNHSWHPASRGQCEQKVLKTGLIRQNPEYEKICGAKWMAPVPAAAGKSVQEAAVCIDQFEFPNMPCEYPIVWAPSSVAKQVCESMGKRVCNSHEWEGGCAGSMDDTDPYLFSLGDLKARKNQYNKERAIEFAYQNNPETAGVKDPGEICGIYSPNDPDMDPEIARQAGSLYNSIGKSIQCHGKGGDYATCGTNTWPAGMKALCKSPFDVYDMHGNVAEVVNFPRTPSGLAKVGHTDRTERKGSFFVVRKGYPSDCRVRQPYEHFNDFATDKHSYYQEGFRCCKDVR